MAKEIIFKLGKPETNQEFLDFKQFVNDLKVFLKPKRGRVKFDEKVKDFTFRVLDRTTEEEERITVFLKENKTVIVLQVPFSF